MSETTLAPSQTADAALAADERLATKEGRSQFWRATFSCWLGTAMEYVDFALYGLAAGMVFGDVFFPEATPLVALLASFATYSVGFVARPIGALVFGWIGDRKGRRVVLITTVALMGLSTTLIGLIPSYAQIGVWAPACLVILRFAQGFGAGAELSGGAVMLAEYAPAKRRGLVASIIAIGSNSGTLLASLVWLLVLQLDKEDLMSWGWRIPFLASILIAGAALYLRRHVRETPVFERELQQNHQRMLDAAQTAPDSRSYLQRTKAFWVMLGLRIGENGPSYLCQGFIVGYVAKVLMVDKSSGRRWRC
ncbi:Proline porter II [Serratia marcescens]|uniref:Proline porter II n=1 Tax=Serratia marcescens TaxID=615 RepID=A0A379YDW8_SERMA|nr:Proline porter II [Serratia marcescens]